MKYGVIIMKNNLKLMIAVILCAVLISTVFSGCSLRSNEAKNRELANGFLTELFTINSNGRNDELMSKIKNDSDMFTDEDKFHDALTDYCSGISEYLSDDCLDKMIAEGTLWNLDAWFLGAGGDWIISSLIINKVDDADSYDFEAELSSDEEVKQLSGTLSFTEDNLISSINIADYLNQFERTKLNWADSFNTEVDGYFIKPVRYRAISDDIFAEPPVMNIELRSFYLKELVETEGKELVDEIRNWCIENSDKESACFCYKKGRDCWILYYDKNAEPRCAWYEPTLTYERDLKVYIKNTYWELKNVPKGIWCLEKISLPVPVNKIEAHLYIGGGHYERVEIDRIEKAATD